MYDHQNDCYICPEGQTLTTNGNWRYKRKAVSSVKIKRYTTSKCLSCPAFTKCTKSKRGRVIERSQYQPNVDANAHRVMQNKEVYRQRQSIVEHPFGIMKRQWGFDHIMTKKSIKRAEADVGLIFCAFNLRRIINIMDKEKLKAYLKALNLIFPVFSRQFKPIRDNVAFATTWFLLKKDFSKTA